MDAEWLDDATREAARAKLDAWFVARPPINSEAVQDWIYQVLGYFRGCYQGDEALGEASWHAQNLRIRSDWDPVLNADSHAGVHHIRQFFPEYGVCKTDFDLAYWGKRSAA